MSTNKLDITIAIPVKNEETNLRGCLNAIGDDFVKSIVIVDSQSTDGTLKIAKEYGISVVDFEWNGQFPKKRNWFMRNYSIQTEWIMFLDADEYLTTEFKNELRLKINTPNVVGYWLNYSIFFLGKVLKGGYPLKKLALFKTDSGEYEKIDENQWSKLDMEVHEHPLLNGNIGIIKSKIDHQDFRGVSHYVVKHNEYAAWEAARFLKVTSDVAISSGWTRKQKIKYWLLNTPLVGPAFFLGSFFLLGGFRDGARGLAFAILKMSYFTQVYCKIKELKYGTSNNQPKSVVTNTPAATQALLY
ncbi:MAG: glycosyltransferase family 2 protein [Aquabacterium sp.]|nr:glycosyltransferase family 2 protein [Ferruginibacter sp.]